MAPLDAIADQRQPHGKLQLLIEDQHPQAADGKTGQRVARAGLVQAKAAQRRSASGEEPLRQGNVRCGGLFDRLLNAEARRTRKNQPRSDARVGRILRRGADETGARAE